MSEAGEGNALIKGNAACFPPAHCLGAYPQMSTYFGRSYRVYKRAMFVKMSHDPEIHGALTEGKRILSLETHSVELSFEDMEQVANRIRRRLSDMNAKQTDVAAAAGLTPARFGNYVQGKRTPDILTLARIARALNVSTDWLLGISEAGPVEIKPVVLALLELERIPPERAEAIASTVQAALRILAGLPDEGDIALRSRTAAIAAYQARRAPEQG